MNPKIPLGFKRLETDAELDARCRTHCGAPVVAHPYQDCWQCVTCHALIFARKPGVSIDDYANSIGIERRIVEGP